MHKAHADVLAAKAGDYFRAKSLPRNFCKAVEDVDEGMGLLKAFEECCEGGMDPAEGTNLILKCAGAMGGPLTGPLAATLATRPVKKLADGTGMGRQVAKAEAESPREQEWQAPVTEEMRQRARAILKAHHDATTRTVNGKLVQVAAYDDKVQKKGKKVGHYLHHEGKTSWHEGDAPAGAQHATLSQRTVIGQNKNQGWFLRATNTADAKAISEAYYQVVGDTAPAFKAGGANHHGNQSAFPHLFLGHGQDNFDTAVKVVAKLKEMEGGSPAPVQEAATAPAPNVAEAQAEVGKADQEASPAVEAVLPPADGGIAMSGIPTEDEMMGIGGSGWTPKDEKKHNIYFNSSKFPAVPKGVKVWYSKEGKTFHTKTMLPSGEWGPLPDDQAVPIFAAITKQAKEWGAKNAQGMADQAPAPAGKATPAHKPKPWHEHDWGPVVDKATEHNAHSSGEDLPTHATKEELQEFLPIAMHAAVVAQHKHKAGLPIPEHFGNSVTWESVAKKWAHEVGKVKKALAMKG